AAAELEKTARDIRNLLAQLERKRREESQRARSEGRNPQPYTGNFAQGQGRLDWPVRGRIIGHYGTETHPKWGTVTMNNGIDIEAAIGTPGAREFLERTVESGRIANAYLFHGPAGVGKGTAALAFARALLCERRGARTGPPAATPSPPDAGLRGDACGACAACAKVAA